MIATDKPGTQVTLMNSVAEQLTAWTTDEAREENCWTRFSGSQAKKTGDAVPKNPVDKVLRMKERLSSLANHTVLTARDGTPAAHRRQRRPDQRRHRERSRGCARLFRDATAARMAQAHLLENDKPGRTSSWRCLPTSSETRSPPSRAMPWPSRRRSASSGACRLEHGGHQPADQASVPAD